MGNKQRQKNDSKILPKKNGKVLSMLAIIMGIIAICVLVLAIIFLSYLWQPSQNGGDTYDIHVQGVRNFGASLVSMFVAAVSTGLIGLALAFSIISVVKFNKCKKYNTITKITNKRKIANKANVVEIVILGLLIFCITTCFLFVILYRTYEIYYYR